MSSDSAALAKITVSGTYILTSTEANRESRAVPGERYTAFAAELLSILEDGIPGRESDVLLSELNQPLQVAMARRGFPKPRNLTGDTGGSVVIRRASASRRQDESRPLISDDSLRNLDREAGVSRIVPEPRAARPWDVFYDRG
ncbi:hypothetical protein [Amycolatopsis sp. cmx-4-68]|uniref:hypothetical protein n=1 Tax=Amycolatopsis sp. cmx-4-68 TaxID=2790938 RepID=UPI00397BC050